MSAKPDTQFHVWDSYWSFDRLCSFDIDVASAHWAALQRHWAAILDRLPPGAKILDIGCGNGAVGLALARASHATGKPVEISAIDDAEIDPERYCPDHASTLKGIAFKSRVRMELLPFEDGTFDAVVSQYAIEYGNMLQSVAEAMRVLKPTGLISVIALPGHCPFVQQAAASIKQARYLLSDFPLFEDAKRILKEYHEPAGDRDQIMTANLQQFSRKVEEAAARFTDKEFEVVSAVVTRLYDIIIKRTTEALDAQLAAVDTFRTDMAHYAARCQLTTKAAVGDRRYDALRTALKKELTIDDMRAIFTTTQGVIGVQLTGSRAAAPPMPVSPAPVAPSAPPA